MTIVTLTVPARRRRGSGSIRERRPGAFEARVAVGMNPAGSHTRQRSITVHGTRDDAEAQAAGLVAAAATGRTRPPGRLLALSELLDVWLAADHPWKPSTLVGYRCAARRAAAAAATIWSSVGPGALSSRACAHHKAIGSAASPTGTVVGHAPTSTPLPGDAAKRCGNGSLGSVATAVVAAAP